MRGKQGQTRPCLMLCGLLGALLTLSACAQKAKTIQIGAIQFESESLAAIEKIDALRRQETQATPLSPQEASAFFVEGVKKSTGKITRQTLGLLLEPLQLDLPQSEAQWQTFLVAMRQQYTTFAVTFASLDKGSLFASSAVPKAVPILDKLIIQMTAFAQSINNNPAEFIRERAAIADELEQVRDKKPFTEATDLKLLELEKRLREVVAAEEQMTRDTIEQALKAATLGTELRKLLLDYSKLSVNDISEGLSVAFKLVAGIPALDLAGLKEATDNLVNEIKSDEQLASFFDTALSEISQARAAGG
jgi:hypothetical protein